MFQTHGLSIRAMRLACCRIVCLLLVSNREGRELHAEHRLDQINSLLPHIFAGRRSGRHSPESAALNSTLPATNSAPRIGGDWLLLPLLDPDCKIAPIFLYATHLRASSPL
jgi:hypothetical protein